MTYLDLIRLRSRSLCYLGSVNVGFFALWSWVTERFPVDELHSRELNPIEVVSAPLLNMWND